MSSGDFMNLTFRNTTTYRSDGSFIPDGYIFTVSSYGKQNWTNNLKLNNLVVSTLTLNSSFNVASTTAVNIVVYSTLSASTTETRNLTFSTLTGSSIVTNSLTLNSNLNVGSTFASLLQTSTLLGSSLRVASLSTSVLDAQYASISSLSTGTHTTQMMTVVSTLSGSTLTLQNGWISSLGVSTLVGSTAQITGALTTSSLAVSGQTVFSTMLGSTLNANALTLQSTLVGSSIQCVNLLSERATVNALLVPSTITVSSAVMNLATVSSFVASTLITGLTQFSTMIGAAITASTMTLNTVVINSTLTTSTFATGALSFTNLVGNTIYDNILVVNSTATISTTTTSTIVINRLPTTATNPPYKMVVEQGPGLNENALYIGNSNSVSAQGVSIGMVNQGFSFFGTYAKIQGKRSGSAGVTNLVLQSDEGRVGIGTTNPDALLDIYAPSGTPGTMFLYNGASGTNSTGVDVTVAAFNMGSVGSGLYYDSIRIRVPNGQTTSAARMDFCTPAGVADNTQTTRLSIMPYSGNVGIGSSNPTYSLDVNGEIYTTSGLRVGSRYRLMSSGGQFGIYDYTNNAWCIAFDNAMNCTMNGDLTVNGKITIAQNTAAVAALHFKNQYDTGYLVMYGAAGGSSDPAVYFNTSDGSRGIMSGVFQAGYSDHRLKTNVQRIESSTCLEYMDQFNAYQFDFIDQTHGMKNTIGFMATEVKAILPTLVNERADYLPNIMETAVITRVSENEVRITPSKEYDALVIGCRVKFVHPRTFRYYIGELIAMEQGAATFRMEEKVDDLEEAFIYGTKVQDVKTLNYHSIFSMAVGAIKELHRKNNELQANIEAIYEILLRNGLQ